MNDSQFWAMLGGVVILGLGQLTAVLLNNSKQERLAEKVDGINDRLDRMNGRIDTHDVRIGTVEVGLAHMQGSHTTPQGN